jgi:hypothetical protein
MDDRPAVDVKFRWWIVDLLRLCAAAEWAKEETRVAWSVGAMRD